MKLHHIASAAALLCIAGHASAQIASANAATNKLYISGSSALKNVIKGMITQNCVGGAASVQIWSDTATNGSNDNVYYCPALTNPNDFNAVYNGQSLTVVKRESGGSANGVFPVAQNIAVPFLDITATGNCSDSTFRCSTLANVIPDAGVSDMEPVQFNDPINRPSAFSNTTTFPNVANANFQTGSPRRVVQQVFGLLVNQKLFDDLKTDQGLGASDIPSISAAAFSTIYGPGYASATQGWVPLFKRGTSITGLDQQVNICTRAAGSGTRATAQLFFNQTPSGKSAQPFAGQAERTVVVIGTTVGQTYISEESSSGNVATCVASAQPLSGYAVGLVSMDTTPAAGTQFVKISGATPGRVSAREGQYGWVYEATMQTNKNAVAATRTLADRFATAMQVPTNVSGSSVPEGVMAVPSATCANPATPAAVKDYCSRVTRGSSSASVLTLAQ